MQFLAVPFDPPASRDGTASSAASQLQTLIDTHAGSGWDYIGLDNHSTIVPGSMGCFGIGATPPYPRTISITVFRK